jgi:zinc transport system substrate-binding protein
MARVLAAADPTNANLYAANAELTVEKIKSASLDVAGQLAATKDRSFIVFHDAYQYFEKRFGLSASGSITIDPDKRPGARRLNEIRTEIDKRNTICVFAEPQFEVSYLNTVIEGTKARTARLDPIGIDAADYPDLIKRLAASIVSCLKG